MRYGALNIVNTNTLTPEQLHIAISIGAEMEYEHRLHMLARDDWEEAWKLVKTDANPWPKDEEIRPVADAIYHERVKHQINDDCNTAVNLLVGNGDLHPSEDQIRAKMAAIYQDRLKKEQEANWLKAEKDAHETNRVWAPVHW